MYPATKTIYRILKTDEEIDRFRKENPSKWLESFRLYPNCSSSEGGFDCKAEFIEYIHDYDEPAGNVAGVDYSDTASEWPTVQECLIRNGLKEQYVDYFIDEDYDEF